MKIITLISGMLLGGSLLAQSPVVQMPANRTCGTPVPDENWNRWFNQKVEEFKAQSAQGKNQMANYTIPVVVHVIHAGQNPGVYPNLSQTQINSQITVLNKDYSGTGLGVSSLPAVFAGLVSNCNVTFCMAALDPNGVALAEAGIDRVNYTTISGATNPASAATPNAIMSLMDNVIKPATIWDPVRYLNIWVSDVSTAAQLLGYATFPAGSGLNGLSGFGSSTNDGVWVWGRSFGTNGTAFSPYNQGRTATHEVGHWLGLRHTWGDANCGTDFCNDTPPGQTSNFGCKSHPFNTGVCSGNTTGEMFQNFMDYSDDACLALFTPDQRTRIQTAMANGIYRSQLTASSATLCNLQPLAPTAAFSATNESCVDSTVVFTNQSTGVPGPSFAWSIQPNNGASFMPSASAANPSVSFSTPAFYTITLVATNASGSNTVTATLDIYDCGNLDSVHELSALARNLQVWPNPSTGEFKLEGRGDPSKMLSIEVYNPLGLKVYATSSPAGGSSTMNLSHLPEGMYFLVLSDGVDKALKRLVIQK